MHITLRIQLIVCVYLREGCPERIQPRSMKTRGVYGGFLLDSPRVLICTYRLRKACVRAHVRTGTSMGVNTQYVP